MLLGIFSMVAPRDLHAVSPSGQFETRLAALQREGLCSELPKFGVTTHPGRYPDDVNVRLVDAAGSQMVRIDVPWIDLERGATFDFSQLDHLIQDLRLHHAAVLLILAYGHPDHSDGWSKAKVFPLPPRTAQQREAFYAFAQAVASRFHGPDVAYQIWNEPNMDWFWPDTASAEDYGALLTGAAKAIREIKPNATIVAAGIANEPNRDAYERGLVARTDLSQVDGLAFHPYRQDGPENSLLDIAEFESRAAAGGAKGPLWLTEWGYTEAWLAKGRTPEETRRYQGVMTARLMLTAAIAKAKAVIVYDLIDDGPDASNPEFRFGMYDHTFEPKDAARAFRSVVDLTTCDTYRFAFDPATKVVTATFRKASIASHVVWTYRIGRAASVCFDPGDSTAIRLTDLFGRQIALEQCPSSSKVKLDLSEAAGPLILEIWEAR